MPVPLPRPDFLHPRRRPGVLAWAWLATGAVVLLCVLIDLQAAWQQRALAQQRLASLQAPPVTAAAPRMQAGPAPAKAAGPDLAAQAQQWTDRLVYPWPAVWQGIEHASIDGLAWVSLDHSAGGALRLVGTARTSAPALAAVQALRGHGLWRDVQLSRIEQDGDSQRLEINALTAWRGPAGRWP